MSIVFAVLLTLSIMAPSLNPEKWPIAILFSLFFQYFFIINFILAIYWLVRQRLYIILPLFPLVMGYNIFARSFNIIIKDEVETNRPKINLLTYNTRLFDLYNWSHNLETRAKMFNYIKDTKSDIICLQEFYTDDNPKSKFSNIDTLKQITGLKYETHHYTTTFHKKFKTLKRSIALDKYGIFLDLITPDTFYLIMNGYGTPLFVTAV